MAKVGLRCFLQSISEALSHTISPEKTAMNKFYRWSESEKSGKMGSGDRFSSMGEAPGTRDEAVGSSVDIRHWLVSWWPTQSHGPVPSFCIAFSLGSWGLQKPEGVRFPQTIVFQDEREFQSEPYFTTFLLRVYSLSSLTKNAIISFHRTFQQHNPKIIGYLELHHCLTFRKFLNFLMPVFQCL